MANEEFKRGGTGKIVQIIGAVVDVRFQKHELPRLLNAIECENNGQRLVLEVAQHIGDDIVRCIAMSSTSQCSAIQLLKDCFIASPRISLMAPSSEDAIKQLKQITAAP